MTSDGVANGLLDTTGQDPEKTLFYRRGIHLEMRKYPSRSPLHLTLYRWPSTRDIEYKTESKRRHGQTWPPATAPAVERSTGRLSQRKDRIRPELPEPIRLHQDLPQVINTQPTLGSILPMQELSLWIHLSQRRRRSYQHFPEGGIWGTHAHKTGHKSPCHVFPGCRTLVA